MTVIQRAKFMDKFMTGFFYVVAGFSYCYCWLLLYM